MTDEKGELSFTTGGTIVKPADPTEGFAVGEKEWDRLYRHVDRIKGKRSWPQNLLFVAIGSALAAAVPMGGWVLQSPTSQAANASQGWLYGAVVAASILIAILCFLFMQGDADALERSKLDVLEEMRDLHMPLSARTDSDEDQSSSAAISSGVQT